MNNHYDIEWVSFEEIWELLIEKFDYENFFEVSTYPYGPNIDILLKLICAKYSNIESLQKIDKWNELENGLEIQDDFFTELLFNDVNFAQFDYFYIIQDKSFQDRKILKVNAKHLVSLLIESDCFAEHPIFQLSDIIFISNKTFTISFINHNGYFLSIKEFLNLKLRTVNN